MRQVRGAVTVYFSVVSLLLLALLGALVEGARMSVAGVRLPEATQAAAESLLSQYDATLFSQYGVMFLREDKENPWEKLLRSYAEPILDPETDRLVEYDDLMTLSLKDVWVTNVYHATEGQGAYFVRQVLELMRYEEVNALLEMLQNMLQGEETGTSLQDALQSDQDTYENTDWQAVADELEQTDSELDESDGEATHPPEGPMGEAVDEAVDNSLIGTIKRILEQELFQLILPGKTISGKKADIPLWKTYAAPDGVSFPSLQMAEKAMLVEYIHRYFGNARHPGQGALAYEQEFILCGNDRDPENLTSVLFKLMGLRLPMNLISIVSHSGLKNQVDATANLLVGWLGIPGLVVLVSSMLMIAWAAGESILDVRGLLHGQLVPFFKNASNMTSSLADCAALVTGGARAREGTGGIGYDMYLRFFLYQTIEHAVERTMKMMEMNLRLQDSDFRWDTCYYGVRVRLEAELPRRMAPLYRWLPMRPWENRVASEMELTY